MRVPVVASLAALLSCGRPAAAGDEDLAALTAAMTRKVEEIRGLKFKTEVAKTTATRQELEAGAAAEAAKLPARGGEDSWSRTLVFFGLLPEHLDARAAVGSMMAGGVEGFYRPDTKTFTLVEGAPGVSARATVFHELIHAVEDQYYDYHARRMRLFREDRDDEELALRAVVEGSAQFHTERYLESEPGLAQAYLEEYVRRWMGGSEGAPPPAKPGAGTAAAGPPPGPPAYLTISCMMFPYHNGATFLRRVIYALDASKGDPVGQVYADPPVSTEQILHPEKYRAPRDLPREVLLPDLAPVLGKEWKPLGTGTWGELSLGMILNAGLLGKEQDPIRSVLRFPPDGFRSPTDFFKTGVEFRYEAGVAASGWDGDRFAVFARGEETCAAWVLVFDTPKDAGEFAMAYGKVIRARYKALYAEPIPGGYRWPRTRGGESAILEEGDRVTVLERVPGPLVEKLLEALRATKVVADPKDAVPGPAKEPPR